MNVLKFILETSRSYRLYIIGMLITILGIAAHSNFQSYFIKLMIDSIDQASSYSLKQVAIWYGVFQLISVCCWYCYDMCAYRLIDMRCLITSNMHSKIMQHHIAFFQDNFSGSISSKVKEASHLSLKIIHLMIDNYIQLMLVVIVATILLTKTHWFFSLSLLIWVPICIFIIYRNINTVRNLSIMTAESDAKIWGQVVDSFSNIFSIKYFATNRYEERELNKVQDEYKQNSWDKGVFLTRLYLLLGLVFSTYILICIYFLISLYQEHKITAGDFAFVFAINYKIVDQLFSLTHSLREFITNWGTIEKSLELVANAPVIRDTPNASILYITKGRIEFQGIKFHYKGTDPLFNNLSVIIKPGQKVGLVGYSGGGKTTFANLLLRLYEVTEGSILIDSQNIAKVTQESLRKSIGMIPQDPSLFHRSLMENIRYGRIDASDEEVIEAAKKAHAHEFIIKLPKSYDSLVGERGVKLSGGQRQRIAIARAILKNAPILILDEATSQLDSITESNIQDSMLDLMQGKTALVIAHRLSTLLHMDRILVFEAGKIIEDGSHSELLAKSGLYKSLWDAQVGGFLPDQKIA